MSTGQTCCLCGEELFEHEAGYCEDCRDGGDLETVLEHALAKTNEKTPCLHKTRKTAQITGEITRKIREHF